jgi:hypothetical protein
MGACAGSAPPEISTAGIYSAYLAAMHGTPTSLVFATLSKPSAQCHKSAIMLLCVDAFSRFTYVFKSETEVLYCTLRQGCPLAGCSNPVVHVVFTYVSC